MYRRVPLETSSFESSRSYQLTCVALTLWWVATLYPLLGLRDTSEGLEAAAEVTESGSLYNQALIILFTCLGVIYLPRALRSLRINGCSRLVLWLFAAYLLWSFCSVLWSEDPALTVRRTGALTLLALGAVGLGGGFYGRSRQPVLMVARHTLMACCIAIVFLVATRVWGQPLTELLSPEWTLKHDTQAQSYAFPIGYGLVASLVLFHDKKLKQLTWASLFFLILVVLLKTRIMVLGVCVACLVVESRFAAAAMKRMILNSASTALIVLMADLTTGGKIFLSLVGATYEKLAAFIPYLTIGEGLENLETLSGRIPLWQSLWPYFTESPLIGHGFGAFWNPHRFEEIYKQAGWRAVVAHNGFLDELLATGTIGLCLFLAFWLYSMRAISLISRQQSQAGILVFGWLLLFLMFNSMGSIMQFYFAAPTLFSLTGLFAFLSYTPEYVLVRRPGPSEQYQLLEIAQ